MSRAFTHFAQFCALSVFVAGCAPAPATGPSGEAEKDPAFLSQTTPPGATPGTCWGKITSPAVIETVTEQIILEPATVAPDGSVQSPAVFKTDTQQRIIEEREETWFETPCPAAMTPSFIASLQRALAARRLYAGPITGTMDARTRAAVRRYQSQRGLDTGILALETAREFGLAQIARGT